MIETIKQKLALRCMKIAAYYAEKGGFENKFKNTMKSLKWVEKSLIFANDDERYDLMRDFLERVEGFVEIISTYKNEEQS